MSKILRQGHFAFSCRQCIHLQVLLKRNWAWQWVTMLSFDRWVYICTSLLSLLIWPCLEYLWLHLKYNTPHWRRWTQMAGLKENAGARLDGSQLHMWSSDKIFPPIRSFLKWSSFHDPVNILICCKSCSSLQKSKCFFSYFFEKKSC